MPNNDLPDAPWVTSTLPDAPWASPPQENPQRSVLDKLLGIGGPRFQTFPERAVRGIAGDIQQFMQAGAAGPPGSRAVTEAAIGPSVNIAATMGPAESFGAVRSTAKATGVPTQEQLLGVYQPEEAKELFNVPLHPNVFSETKQKIIDELHKHNFRPHLSTAKETFESLGELDLKEGKTSLGKDPNVMDLESVRRVLNNVHPQEKRASFIAKDIIDDALSELKPQDVLSRDPSVGAKLQEIRANYGAGKRSSRLTTAQERGEAAAQRSGSGANLDNALRQQIDKIISNPKENKWFSKEEIEELKKAREGSTVANIARLASKLGPKHPLSGWWTSFASLLHGDLGAAAGTMGVGHVAQKVSEGSRLRDIAKVDELVRRRSPMFEKQGTLTPAQPLTPEQRILLRGAIYNLVRSLASENASQQTYP